MGVYCANQEVIHCFINDETIPGVGPNEVISVLEYFLQKLQTEQGRDRYNHLIVWYDNSPAQFKQNFLFLCLVLVEPKTPCYRAHLCVCNSCFSRILSPTTRDHFGAMFV